jgi:uncharacterized protein (TIGR03437 family)
MQQAGKLVATETSGNGLIGSSAALSADGTTVILGGPVDNAAWVFVQTTNPTIAPGGVVNGASFQAGIAPGTWITITGANLSASTRTWTAADFTGNNLPTQLDGVSVAVNGRAAYVSYISPTQLNLLTPDDATFDSGKGSVAIQVLTPQGNTNAVTASEAPFSLAMFTFKGAEGQLFVAAVFPDGTYAGTVNAITGYPTVPAKPGDTIILFGTGFGPTTPPSPIGQMLNPAPLANPVTVKIGGITASTQFAGIVGPGLYQFNVVVPNVQSGNNPVVATIAGNSSQANVFLTVQ